MGLDRSEAVLLPPFANLCFFSYSLAISLMISNSCRF